MRLSYALTVQVSDFTVESFALVRRLPGGRGDLWLIQKLTLYLTGFYESRIRPESQKNTQKVACENNDGSPFTLVPFTMSMVDFVLQSARGPGFTARSWLPAARRTAAGRRITRSFAAASLFARSARESAISAGRRQH
jgi:hypothetical protein